MTFGRDFQAEKDGDVSISSSTITSPNHST